MKKIIKYLSVLLIAGVSFLQAMNVFAFSCDSGEVVHTNYYLFLDVNSYDYYNNNLSSLEDGSYFYEYTRTNKYNNLPNITESKKLSQGNVGITDGTDSTNVDTDLSSWSIATFWKNYYLAKTNADSDTLVYDMDGSATSYILHDAYESCDSNFSNCTTKSSATADALLKILASLESGNNYNGSELVKYGTALPRTTVQPASSLLNNTKTTITFNVERKFASSALKSGVTINDEKKVFSPAVYMVQFCDDPVGGYTWSVIFDENTTDTVTNMPADISVVSTTSTCRVFERTIPVREGYTFVGWATSKDSTEVAYAPGAEYCGPSDLHLYAIWEGTGTSNNTSENGTGTSVSVGDSFTITYNANGGKNAPATQTGTVGTCTYISSSSPSLSGNRFLGWSTNSKAQEPDKDFNGGSCYDGASGSITLYAVWQTQTGISSHILVFGGIVLIAIGAFVIAKKKNLFRQV